jgi:uncharacterized protein
VDSPGCIRAGGARSGAEVAIGGHDRRRSSLPVPARGIRPWRGLSVCRIEICLDAPVLPRFQNKAAANVRKHEVQFSEALGVFSDDYAITIAGKNGDPDEERFVTLGIRPAG